jgi:hypothetical protein
MVIDDNMLIEYRAGTEPHFSCEKGQYDVKLVTACFSRSILGGD